jgi:Cu-Zn family superoxide dismutase
MLGDKMNTLDIINIVSSMHPYAYANIQGNNVMGRLMAYGYHHGTILVVEADGLPITECNQGIHALHIHEGSSCESIGGVPYAASGNHFTVMSCPHPYHTGDLPPLFSTNGQAWMAVYIDKFTPDEIVGRTVIIHQNIDDFTSQPSGNAGTKIACGEIVRL